MLMHTVYDNMNMILSPASLAVHYVLYLATRQSQMFSVFCLETLVTKASEVHSKSEPYMMSGMITARRNVIRLPSVSARRARHRAPVLHATNNSFAMAFIWESHDKDLLAQHSSLRTSPRPLRQSASAETEEESVSEMTAQTVEL